MRNENIFQSFKCAFEGIIYTVKTQRNVYVHIAATIIVLILGLLLNFSSTEMAVLMLTCALVVTCEIINTAIEKAVDLATTEYHEAAKIAKDAAAGAVLFSAVSSIIIGVILFLPKLIKVIL